MVIITVDTRLLEYSDIPVGQTNLSFPLDNFFQFELSISSTFWVLQEVKSSKVNCI